MQSVNNYIAADVVARNPAQIIIAAEVDDQFIAVLKDPQQSTEANSTPLFVTTPAAAGSAGQSYQNRDVNIMPWHVAATSFKAMNLTVAARPTRAGDVEKLQQTNMFHKECIKKRQTNLTYSKLLCARVHLIKSIHGRGEVTILNVHFHHMVAKKVPAAPLISNSLGHNICSGQVLS